MKFWMDTEFMESGHLMPLTLLSIGIVAEDGREFYAVNGEADHTLANDWVKVNVLPHLGKSSVMRHVDIGHAVLKFVDDGNPEFWGYYADYDWVVFCQLFGAMIDLPKGWPMYCNDLKQLAMRLGNPSLPKQFTTEHNALSDARWNKSAHDYLLEVGHSEECLEGMSFSSHDISIHMKNGSADKLSSHLNDYIRQAFRMGRSQ